MFGFIGNIGPWELILILVVALIVVGPGKLPEVAKSMGKAAREFKKATTGVQKEFQDALKVDEKPAPAQKEPEAVPEKIEVSPTVSLDELNEMSLNNKEKVKKDDPGNTLS
ncbi:MAG: Sec-independent protein translocase protein TatB [Syntrophomonas sp.]|uniref:Sec-independent protein translocase protein TatA n=1 Tax=Syntrophomonas wolfei subsp. wolfei (strain DSM 2245B / Goettingen) TaxID=335541 RepID=Q0AX04_SYNWW|nr:MULTISPECIES: Sec-independent protein translocase protein TatB [Syntrophomonas]ABI68750.1 Sec-independent protein translocase TatA [Syntrophomonas wolfei subsp. wolfei str. Goettingen G311]MDD2511495.1 Sec-independent protein translocase protein TatB [Syntrophomonas sp.]MDD3878543.1 Sec-independent protein translocase protein TatB [Syntrophomonas sp.]MDD4626336.1 Sec-independent protein translocase protein TatB [Syntrophomonas sp.]